MTYTHHGYHIQGSPVEIAPPSNIAHCGGPGFCQECSHEASIWNHPSNPKPKNCIDIGIECFIDNNVITYKGENYYKACGEFVYSHKGGGQSFCVKRFGHLDRIHEASDGMRNYAGIVEVPEQRIGGSSLEDRYKD